MASQGSSRADFLDLTGEDDVTLDSQTAFSSESQSTSSRPSRSTHYPPQNNVHAGTTSNSAFSQGNVAAQADDDDSDIEMVEDAPLDEAARRRNLESRRARLHAGGINEEENVIQNDSEQQRGGSVSEVIVISDGEEGSEDEDTDQWMGPRFWEERRRRRGWNNWADDLEERRRHPNARRFSPDPLNFQFAPHLLPTMTPRNGPRIALGGGGLASRGRPLSLPIRNAGPSMHRHSVQMDGERLPGRVRAHLGGLVQEQEAAYNDLNLPVDIPGVIRNAVERLGGVFSGLGWGNAHQEDNVGEELNGWGPALLEGRDEWGWGGGRGEGGRARRRFMPGGIIQSLRGPPPDEDEPPLHLPEAPEWQMSFTHPKEKMHELTGDVSPVKPELIVLEDSDDEGKRKKGKGKARAPPPGPISDVRGGQKLTIVCAVCKDPIILGGETDEERTYGLRCGHVLDGKCLWKIAKPSKPEPPPSDPATNTPKASKGKDLSMTEPEQAVTGINPNYGFTFVPPAPIPASTSDFATVYEEDNDPRAAPVSFRSNPIRSSRRHDEVVPTPNVSRPWRTRGQRRRNALDGVDDEFSTPDQGPGPLNIIDPFFPVLATATPARGTRGGRGGARGSRKTRTRKVPKTRGRLKEEVFEWTCPVPGCGRQHVSVKLEMEGAKWKCDPVKGAVLMFL